MDTPILRIPLTRTPPTIDGVMAEGEWEDASALSGFWYDFANADFRFMAPIQTQLQVYAAYDKDNLYIAYSSPVYPESSWLKGRGRFPDVLNHPLYGILWDDHTELEIRPYHDIAKGFQFGLLRWDVNVIGAYCDWYWSLKGGQGMQWKSNAVIRTQADSKRWVIEYAIPLKELVHGEYAGTEEDGRPLVTVPPPDGTIYRAWFVRGIGGNGAFFNAFDQHCWNTTKTQIIFDSKAPSFQINELGPIMEDVIDLQLTVKNHNTRSETLRIGFFVESAEGLIYSSYEAPELNQGLVELRPGEVRKLRLKQPFPGISTDGNVLWFDVRAAGRPAKVLFRTRLVRFHSMDGGKAYDTTMMVEGEDSKLVKREISFRERRIDVIATLRPPRKDFEFHWNFSPYTKRVSGIVDRGIHGASDEVQTAVEAKLMVLKDNEDEDMVYEVRGAFHDAFATFLFDTPDLVAGESYKLSLLLFDENKRIVGEANPEPFTYEIAPWRGTEIGLDDVVWEGAEPMKPTGKGFTTGKHEYTLAPTGLPAQIHIRPDVRELPLEKRADPASVTAAELMAMRRGDQLRAPMRLEAVVGGKRVAAAVKTPAKLMRTWKSELEYTSELSVGGVPVTLNLRYDCDGSMHAKLKYGGAAPVRIDSLELVADLLGPVDLAYSETGNGSMTAADVRECFLPRREGVVWDSTSTDMELFYSKFIPWFWFGTAEQGFTWFCDSDQNWMLDKEGTTMQMVRDEEMRASWRVLFVNHPVEVKGEREIEFSLLVHPAKDKPKNVRTMAWHHFGGYSWAAGYALEPIDLPDEYLIKRWHQAASAPKDMPYEKATEWRKDDPPFYRYGQWRNVGVCAALDQEWEDKATYFFERHIRVGRRVGWWMDEYFPVCFGRSNNLAQGNAYLRDPETVAESELPWQSCFLTYPMRNHYRRLARVFAKNNVPQRQHTWANNAATMLEPFLYSTLLVEDCGAGHRAFDVDNLVTYPNAIYQVLSHGFAGIAATLCADACPSLPGDDKRLCRQLLGRCLLHDIGFSPHGPHGTFVHKEQGVRLLRILTEFGFFEDTATEKLPFHRNREIIRMGDGGYGESGLPVTVYRRPLEDGKGYKILIVVLNETLKPVEVPLHLLDAKRLLGGANTLQATAALARATVPESLAGWWAQLTAGAGDGAVLLDAESGDTVVARDGSVDVYGPLYVPYHDYRLLYAEHREP